MCHLRMMPSGLKNFSKRKDHARVFFGDLLHSKQIVLYLACMLCWCSMFFAQSHVQIFIAVCKAEHACSAHALSSLLSFAVFRSCGGVPMWALGFFITLTRPAGGTEAVSGCFLFCALLVGFSIALLLPRPLPRPLPRERPRPLPGPLASSSLWSSLNFLSSSSSPSSAFSPASPPFFLSACRTAFWACTKSAGKFCLNQVNRNIESDEAFRISLSLESSWSNLDTSAARLSKCSSSSGTATSGFWSWVFKTTNKSWDIHWYIDI